MSGKELSSMGIAELRAEAKRLSVDLRKCIDKDDMVALIARARSQEPKVESKPAPKPAPKSVSPTPKPAPKAAAPSAAGSKPPSKDSPEGKLAAALRLVDAIIGVYASRERDASADGTRMRVLKLIKPPEKYKGTDRGTVHTSAGRKVAYRSFSMLLHTDKHRGAASEADVKRLKLGFRSAEACMKEFQTEVLTVETEMEEAIQLWLKKNGGGAAAMGGYGRGWGAFGMGGRGPATPTTPEPPDITAEAEWRCVTCGVKRLFGGSSSMAVRKQRCMHQKCGGKRESWMPTSQPKTPATPSFEIDPEVEVFEVDEFELSSEEGMDEAPETPCPGTPVPESPLPRQGSATGFSFPNAPDGESTAATAGSDTPGASLGRADSFSKKKKKRKKKGKWDTSSDDSGPTPGISRASSFSWGGGDELGMMLGRKMSNIWNEKSAAKKRKRKDRDSDSSSSEMPEATHVQVPVPDNVQPGQMLEVTAQGRKVTVVVPEGVLPGEVFIAKLPPPEKKPKQPRGGSAPPAPSGRAGTPPPPVNPEQAARDAADAEVRAQEELLRQAREKVAAAAREREKAEAARKLAEMEEEAKRRAAPADAVREAEAALRKAREMRDAAAAERERQEDARLRSEAAARLDALMDESRRRAAARAAAAGPSDSIDVDADDADGGDSPQPHLPPHMFGAEDKAAAAEEERQDRLRLRKQKRHEDKLRQDEEQAAKRRRMEAEHKVKAARMLEKMEAREKASYEAAMEQAREKAMRTIDERERKRQEAVQQQLRASQSKPSSVSPSPAGGRTTPALPRQGSMPPPGVAPLRPPSSTPPPVRAGSNPFLPVRTPSSSAAADDDAEA